MGLRRKVYGHNFGHVITVILKAKYIQNLSRVYPLTVTFRIWRHCVIFVTLILPLYNSYFFPLAGLKLHTKYTCISCNDLAHNNAGTMSDSVRVSYDSREKSLRN